MSLKWQALYTGASQPRPASEWAAESAQQILVESLAEWLADEQVRAETLAVLAEVIESAEAALLEDFEQDCRNRGHIC